MSTYDFQKGEILLVDKPLKWTSFDVVKKLRWQLKNKLGVKKIKVGHAGTLDPLATGLLVICTGKKTKEINDFIVEDKVYTGTIKVGSTTPSYDLESEINETFKTGHINAVLLENARQHFIGEQQQTAPIFSAKKVNGVRAYELARKGEEVVLKSNTITIKDFKIESETFPDLKFYVNCSKGTYIRSLANDFGKQLGSGAHLTELRRTKSGEFTIENAKSIEEWIEIIQNN